MSDAVPVTREMRERGWDLAQAARRRYAERCGAINARFRALKEQRLREHDAAFNKLRDRRQELLADRNRDEAALAEVEAAVKAHRNAPKPPTDDLEQQRIAACQDEDMALAAELDELRRKVRAGELSDELYV